MERTLDAKIADDLLSRINPSVRADKLSLAITACSWGSRQAESAIIKGLELLAQQEKKEEK